MSVNIGTIIDLQEKIVEKYGGKAGVRDLGQLTAAFDLPLVEYDYHGDDEQTAAAFLANFVECHPFLGCQS